MEWENNPTYHTSCLYKNVHIVLGSANPLFGNDIMNAPFQYVFMIRYKYTVCPVSVTRVYWQQQVNNIDFIITVIVNMLFLNKCQNIAILAAPSSVRPVLVSLNWWLDVSSSMTQITANQVSSCIRFTVMLSYHSVLKNATCVSKLITIFMHWFQP